jgi:hypothetical protein
MKMVGGCWPVDFQAASDRVTVQAMRTTRKNKNGKARAKHSGIVSQ